MALADTARLIATLDLKGNFDARIRASEKALGSFDTKLDKTEGRAFHAGQQIGTGIKRGAVIAAGAIGFLAANVGIGLKALVELETVTTQTNAVLKSTKGVSGETAESIRNLAEKYEALNATIDDKVIQSAENVLLTFTAVRKDAFEPAIKAALDMSTALGTDLQGSVIQIGKALQDPIKGITALRRVGVNFSADQIKVIKRLVETGDVLGAQKVILKELNTEFGGSFLAGGQTTAGKVAKFKDSIEDLQKALATALLPTIGKVADKLSAFLADPKVIASVSKLGDKIASLFSDENIGEDGKILSGVFETAKAAAPVLEQVASATLGIVKTAVGLFTSLPKEIQGLAVGAFAVNKLTGGLVTNIGGALLDLVGKSRGASPANPVFVADVTGGKGLLPTTGGGLLPVLGTVATKLAGLTLALGGLAGIGVGTQVGGPAGAGIGALSGAAVIGGGALLAGPLGAIAGSIVAVGKTLLDIRDISSKQGADIASSIQGEIAGGASLADLQKSLAAVNTGINDIQANPLNVLLAGDALDQLRAQRQILEDRLAGPRNTGFEGNPGKAADDLATAIPFGIIKGFNRIGLIALLKTLPTTIAKATKPKDIGAAVAKAVETFVTRKQGNAADTRALLTALREKLGKTHDPKLQEALRSAIAKVERKLPAREFAARQLAKADKILHSNESSSKKLTDLKAIERSLKDHGLPTIARKVGHMEGAVVGRALPEVGKKVGKVATAVAAAQRAQVIASHGTTEAIKDKDLSVTVNTSLTSSVSIQGVFREQRKINRYTTIS